MYTILINDDNTIVATQKQRIIQRSKLVDTFLFLVPALYNGISMADCTVMLEYLKPVSREYKAEFLVKADDMYKEHLQYKLPIDTEFTKEAGTLELQLTFLKTDMTDDGAITQQVRKTAPVYKVEIIPISAWSDMVPDSALTAFDQRVLKQDAQIKALADISEILYTQKADNLAYDEDTNELQLMADGKEIGDKITLKTAIGEIGDEIPVVDFDDDISIEIDDTESNIVKF